MEPSSISGNHFASSTSKSDLINSSTTLQQHNNLKAFAHKMSEATNHNNNINNINNNNNSNTNGKSETANKGQTEVGEMLTLLPQLRRVDAQSLETVDQRSYSDTFWYLCISFHSSQLGSLII